MKRCFDITLSLIGIIIFLPIEILIIIILCLQNKGEIFYIQERIGKNGESFKLTKFLTMKDEKVISSFSQLLRLTALDELPQLINIAKGDMSFVGPRPLIKQEIQELEGKGPLRERLKIRPGLTGVAQVLVSKKTPPEKKVLYDIWYIRNNNLFIDVELILISFLITLFGRWEIEADKLGIVSNFKKRIKI